MSIDTIQRAYIEAIYFTETGDNGQPPHNAELSALSKAQAYLDSRQFYWAVTEDLGIEPDTLDWHQIGHDLWLTRNGHGTGFWDRPDVYGNERCMIFSAMAKAMGQHDVDFEDSVPSEATYHFTVILLRPDYMADNYGTDVCIAHVEVPDNDAALAVDKAKIEAWEIDNSTPSGVLDDNPAGDASDYHCIAAYEGHINAVHGD